MYKKTDPQQSLFGVETQLAASLRTRLQDSWAQLFRLEILPILLKSEDQFAMLYGKRADPISALPVCWVCAFSRNSTA